MIQLTIENDQDLVNILQKTLSIQSERLFHISTENIILEKNYILNSKYIYVFIFDKIDNIIYSINNNDFKKINFNAIIVQNVEELYFEFENQTYEIKKIIFKDELLDLDIKIKFDYKVSDNIFLIQDEIIPASFCDEIIRFYENSTDIKREKWEITQNVNCSYINLNDYKENIELKNEIDSKIYSYISKVIMYLNKNYNYKCSGDSGYCIRKIYGPTRLHIDSVIENDNTEFIVKNKIRNLSVIICLNDDYIGGEFYFPIQNKKIKLKKGEIIAFPPYWTHPHMCSTPEQGTYRYTINTWLYQ